MNPQRARGLWMQTVSMVEEIPTFPDDTVDVEDEVTETLGRQPHPNRAAATDAPAPERRLRPVTPTRPTHASARMQFQVGPIPEQDDDSAEIELLAAWMESADELEQVDLEPLPALDSLDLGPPTAPLELPPLAPIRAPSPRPLHPAVRLTWWAAGALSGILGASVVLMLAALASRLV